MSWWELGRSTTTAATFSPSFLCGMPNTLACEHGGMAEQDLLHLQRRDLLAAAVDDVLDAPDDEEIAVGIEIAEVACAQPAVAIGGRVGGIVIIIAAGHVRPAQHDLAMRAGRHQSGLGTSIIAISGPAARPTDPAFLSPNGLAAICEAASVMP